MPAPLQRPTYGRGSDHHSGMVAAHKPGLRRLFSRRTDVSLREGRPLVTGSSPDHAARSGPRPDAVAVPSVPAATPFLLRTLPRHRTGTVPKLAPGKQGAGLGQPVHAGFQTPAIYGFTPLDSGPSTQPSFRLRIPKSVPGVSLGTPGAVLHPTYHAKTFRPAVHQFNQYRSSAPWAQSHFPPQFRPLTPSQQPMLLGRASAVARRQVPAAQINAGLYTIGYPTRVGAASRLGAAGPVAVLGANSQ